MIDWISLVRPQECMNFYDLLRDVCSNRVELRAPGCTLDSREYALTAARFKVCKVQAGARQGHHIPQVVQLFTWGVNLKFTSSIKFGIKGNTFLLLIEQQRALCEFRSAQ